MSDPTIFDPLAGLAAMGVTVDFQHVGFPHMASRLPEHRGKRIRIDHFEVTPHMAMALAMKGMHRGNVRDYNPPGTYVRLLVRLDEDDPDYDDDNDGWSVMMSDTLSERVEAAPLLLSAKGRVLVAGLGLGMLVHGLLDRPGVDTVTVLELNPEVIKAVGPTLPANRVTIVQADARGWAPCDDPHTVYDPGSAYAYDTVLLDIWPVLGSTMRDELAEMRAHYQRLFPGARVEGWMERELALSEQLWETFLDHCRAAEADGKKLDAERAYGLFSARFNDAIEQARVEHALGLRSR